MTPCSSARAHGLDSPQDRPTPPVTGGHLVVLGFGDEPNHLLPGRSKSAPKKLAAAFNISLARRNSANLRLEPLDLLGLTGRHAGTVPGVDLSPARPGADGLRGADTELASHRADRSPLRPVLQSNCQEEWHSRSRRPTLYEIR